MDIGRATSRECRGIFPNAVHFPATADVCDGTPDSALECRRDSWMVDDQSIGYCIEIVKCVFSVDDLHLRRSFANTASTCWSVAKRPSAAARNPRSIPANSSGVGS